MESGERVMSEGCAASFGSRLKIMVSVLALLAAGACAGSPASGPQIEVESPWARPALAAIGHTDDHDHYDHHAPGEEEEHEEHADDAAHHRSSGTTSAVYFVLHNRGGEADRLVAARTEAAGVVELHRSGIEDGVMRMRQVDAIEVPAGGAVRLEPGSYHLMLIGLTRGLEAGDRFEVTLEFERGGTRVVEVEVAER